MVDFQSRDTSRGPDTDAEEADEPTETTDEPSQSEPDAETAADAESEPSTGSGFALVTVDSDPDVDADPAGDAAVEAIESAGEQITTREAVRPDYDGVQRVVDSLVERRDVDAVVTVGGTGVEPDDVTVDAVESLLDKHLPGFGELFRIQGYDEVGTEVIGTRTTAGVVDRVPVFCLPGSPAAARRGVRDLVLAEAERLADRANSGGVEE